MASIAANNITFFNPIYLLVDVSAGLSIVVLLLYTSRLH
jgi:hypothetical protein